MAASTLDERAAAEERNRTAKTAHQVNYAIGLATVLGFEQVAEVGDGGGPEYRHS